MKTNEQNEKVTRETPLGSKQLTLYFCCVQQQIKFKQEYLLQLKNVKTPIIDNIKFLKSVTRHIFESI